MAGIGPRLSAAAYPPSSQACPARSIGLDSNGQFWETPALIVTTRYAGSAMFRSLSILLDRFALGRWCCLATLVACLGMGCTSLNLRGEGFRENELSGWARQARQAEDLGPSRAFSNKARQIDRDLGGPRDAVSDSGL